MTTSDILLRDILATTIHNVEGVECSHVDYKQPSCERDADALVGEVKRYAHEKSIEALTEFHNTTFQDVSTRRLRRCESSWPGCRAGGCRWWSCLVPV
jgi:hypothetical protein